MPSQNINPKKGPPKPGEGQSSILRFLIPTMAAFSVGKETPTVLGDDPPPQTGEMSKKRPLEKGDEKVSPEGKNPKIDDDNDAAPNANTKAVPKRNEIYENVVKIMGNLAPIIADDNIIPNRKAFMEMYQIIVYLSSAVFEDFGTIDRVVKENREIRESNQTMKYAQHCEKVKKEMEKSQRTVKVLDMPVEESLIGNKIENTNTARENVKQTLKTKLNVQSDLLYGSTITLNTRAIREGNVPCAIIAADRDKKIAIEKALRAASKKVVFEWPAYLYSHIKEIRKGYEKSNAFKNCQILIRPAATNNKLVISFRAGSQDRWNFIETLSFPLNPSDLNKFGQNKQPCMSNNKDVNFEFFDAKDYYKNIATNNVETLENGFQKAKNGVPSVPQPGTTKQTTPTRNRFNVLENAQEN